MNVDNPAIYQPSDAEELLEALVASVKRKLKRGCRVFVLTGAGISAESGVPTFRGGGRSLTWRGMPFEQLSSARMVVENLPLVWEWFDHRMDILSECLPNAGHLALADAAKTDGFREFTLVTQNIDGLHAAAGSPDIIEIHGNINEARCRSCNTVRKLSELPLKERPPVCPACSDAMRPNVVLFGEAMPMEAVLLAQMRASVCDVFMTVGTSGLVYPANELPRIAKAAGAFLIEINPEETVLTPTCDVSFRTSSGNLLPLLFSAFADQN